MRPVLLCIFAILSFPSAMAFAQEDTTDIVPDPLDKTYATGLQVEEPSRYNNFVRQPIYRAWLPERVDLSSSFPTPGDQGQMASCVGWAVGYAARSYFSYAIEGLPRNQRQHIASPAYIYHQIRNSENCDKGSHIPDALDLLKSGSLSLAEYPYSDSRCKRPQSRDRNRATEFKIDGWTTVDYSRPDDVKGQLSQSRPVVIGMDVSEDFHKLRGERVYRGGESSQSAHAIVVVGYDDRTQAFKIINSWGRGWGKRGFGWLSYDAFVRVVNEAYVMTVPSRRVPPEPTPQQLSKLDCGNVVFTPRGDGGTLKGYVGKIEDIKFLHATYDPKKFTYAVDVRPWPQCEILKTLAVPLSAADPPRIQISNQGKKAAEGDNFTIDIKTPSAASHVYVSYVQADGKVINLEQPKSLAPTPQMPNTKLVFGDGKAGRAKFTVAPPFGSELIIVLASRSPLFDIALPIQQLERDYLTAVRKALIYKPDPNFPDRDIAAAYVVFETKGKGE